MPNSQTHFPKRSLINQTFRAGGWMFLIVLLLAIGLGLSAVLSAQTEQDFTREGQNAEAVIIKKSTRINGSGTGKARNTVYTVRYRFKTADGTLENGIQSVSKAFFDSVEKDGQYPVRYLLSNPKTSEVEIGRGAKAGTQFLQLAALLFVIGLGGMVIWVRRAKAKITLRDTGEIRRAEVMAHDLIERKNAEAKYGRATWREGDNIGQTGALPVNRLPQVGQMIMLYTAPSGKPAIWEGEVGTR